MVTRQTSSSPTSYDAGTGEGASPPSNPRAVPVSKYTDQLSKSITFRVSVVEKEVLDDIAHKARRPLAELLREALGMVTSGHRSSVPIAPPELLRAVARIEADMDEIARVVGAAEVNDGYLDRVALLSLLVVIDRKLGKLAHSHWSWR